MSAPSRALAAAAVVLALVAGCYVSPYSIGTADDAKVDRAFVGDWEGIDGEKLRLVIRNFNNREYYVEWKDGRGDNNRLSGFVTDVRGVKIANLREISDDGSIKDEYLLMRVELKDDQLTLRHFNESFFESKTIESAEDLRKIVEQNLESEEMYAEQGVLRRVKS
jgi:hypothetical protein